MGAPKQPKKLATPKLQPQPWREVSGYLPERFQMPAQHSAFPSPQYIFTHNGLVNTLIISSPYGSLHWQSRLDISCLGQSLAETVQISQGSVEVYINGRGNPGRGKELNRACLATLKLSKTAQQSIIRQKCKEQDCRLVSLNGCKIQVALKHFSKFTFEEISQEATPLPNHNQSQSEILPQRDSPIDILEVESGNSMDPLNSLIMSKIVKVTEEVSARGKPIAPPYKDLLDGMQYEDDLREQAGFEKGEHETSMLRYMLRGEGAAVSSEFYRSPNRSFVELVNVEDTETYAKPSNFPGVSFEELLQKNRTCVQAWDQGLSLPVRRLVALHNILFSQEIKFRINRVGELNYDCLPSNPYQLSSIESRIRLLAEWLVWVAQTSYSKDELFDSLGRSSLLAAICTRSQQSLLNQLIVNNQWEDMNFIANIQDPAFREGYKPPSSVSPQLQDLFSQKHDRIFSEQWPLQLMLLFTCTSVSFEKAIQSILKNYAESERQRLPVELYLLQIFFVGLLIPSPDTPISSPHLVLTQDLYALYFGLHNIGLNCLVGEAKSRTLIKNYERMRYKLVESVIQQSRDWSPQEKMSLIQRDNTLPQEQKTYLIQKYAGIDNFIHLPSSSNQVLTVQDAFSELGKLFNRRQWSVHQRAQAYRLVTQPNLLTAFNLGILAQLEGLLSERREQFEDVLCMVHLSQRKTLSRQQLVRVCQVVDGQGQFGRVGQAVRRVMRQGVNRLLEQAKLVRSPLAELLQERSVEGDLVRSVLASTL